MTEWFAVAFIVTLAWLIPHMVNEHLIPWLRARSLQPLAPQNPEPAAPHHPPEPTP